MFLLFGYENPSEMYDDIACDDCVFKKSVEWYLSMGYHEAKAKSEAWETQHIGLNDPRRKEWEVRTKVSIQQTNQEFI